MSLGTVLHKKAIHFNSFRQLEKVGIDAPCHSRPHFTNSLIRPNINFPYYPEINKDIIRHNLSLSLISFFIYTLNIYLWMTLVIIGEEE